MSNNPIYTMLRLDALQDKDVIEVRVGKHKKQGYKDTSVFFRPDTFALFEGTIWTQYREYSAERSNVIAANEWIRIQEELRQVATRIRSAQDPATIKEALRVRHHDLLPEYAELAAFQEELASLFEAFADWIESQVPAARHLSICV
jgi:hypothetical protein